MSNLVSVNTPVGITSRVEIPRIVQQGGGWGPMECSLSVDTIGRRCKDRGIHQYKYKNTVNVLPLAMVDDILAINECGNKSLLMNTFIDTHITMKKLKFHAPDQSGKSKCHKLHIGKFNDFCPKLKVHGSVMENVQFDTYLGDIISSDGKNTLNIRNRVSRGNGIVSQIMNIL